MKIQNKVLWGIAIIGLLLGLIAVSKLPHTVKVPNGQSFGAVGNLLAENYIPYVLYNQGYNSAKDMSVSGNTTLSGTNVFSGATSVSGALSLTSTLKVGSAGTAISNVNEGLCYIMPYAASVGGSGSTKVECQGTAAWSAATQGSALTGVSANDNCSLALSTTTSYNLATTTASANLTVNSPLILSGASASTTAGYITATVWNASTSPYVWPTAIANSTASGTATYICARP